MSSWTAASSDCSRPVNNYVHVKTADLYRPNARLTPERQGYQVLTPFGKLGYSQFDAVLTADQNIEFQQNLKALPIAVVVLVANSNRLESLVPLVADVLQALHTLQPRTLVRVGA